jgi:8-oxo-dGTP diphosphatase
LPYKIAVLCYLYDAHDHLLLLHRLKDPNRGMYSPIGGKLEVTEGEGPHECGLREIHEEAGIELSADEIHLTGIVTERAYEGHSHWLLFLFEVMRPIRREEIANMQMDEGTLEWVPAKRVHEMNIPLTDREIMWPLVKSHRGGGYFQVHVDCSAKPISWHVHESWGASGSAD